MNTAIIDSNGTVYDFSVHKMPVFYEERQKDWILWGYSKISKNVEDKKWNNLQPDYYEWLYNSSSKHRAIINRKTLFINGKGVKPKYDHLAEGEKVELGAFAFKINQSEIVKKWSLNLTKVGGFCYEVIPDKGKKKVEAHYININHLRRSKVEYGTDGREKPPIYYYTKDWTSKRPEENPDFTIFHEWDWETFEGNKRYIVYYAEDEETLYPIPEYTAAIPYIAADHEIANFTFNNTANGFVGSYLINFFNGEMQDEEKHAIYEQVKAKLHGTDNSGEPILSFNEEGTQGVTVTPISPNGQDDRFINLNKQVREEIFAGHTVNPVVVGLEGANGFSNNADEERVATEHFKKYYVEGKQMIIEQHLNALRAFNNIKGEVYIQHLDPVEAEISEAELSQILTEDERRERAGYEPKTEDQKTEVVKETIKETERRFKQQEDDIILDFFAANGMWDEDFEVIRSREFFAENVEDAERQEFATALESAVLRLLGSDPDMKPDVIAKATKASTAEVNDAINKLKSDGLLSESNQVTPEGVGEQDQIFIVYKYALRNDAPKLKGESRPFCQRLMGLSGLKSWTLEDIKRMKNEPGLDVFTSRGGFYTIPDSEPAVHVPYCRHVWRQLLVRRKNG